MSVDPLEANLMHIDGAHALPTDRVFRRVAHSLRNGKLPEYGFLGIQPTFVEQSLQRRNLRGTYVYSVIEGMPGERAGLRVGDVITHIGDRALESRDAIFRELSAYEPGEAVRLVVRRPRTTELLHVDTEVVISKRYMATSRRAYTKTPEARWFGAIVDYATAFLLSFFFSFTRVTATLIQKL